MKDFITTFVPDDNASNNRLKIGEPEINYVPRYIMPFGSHKGKFLDQVPESYFKWLCSEINHKAPNKRTLAEKQVLKYAINKFGKEITDEKD